MNFVKRFVAWLTTTTKPIKPEGGCSIIPPPPPPRRVSWRGPPPRRNPSPTPPMAVDIDLCEMSLGGSYVTVGVMCSWCAKNVDDVNYWHEQGVMRFQFTNDADAVMFKLWSVGAIEKASNKIFSKSP